MPKPPGNAPAHSLVAILLTGALAPWANATNESHVATWESILPVLESKCFDCHGGKKTKGGVDLKRLSKDPSVSAEFNLWNKVVEVVTKGEMPPEEAEQPSGREREAVLLWTQSELDRAARQNAGDPGTVTLRRLTNAEYANALHELSRTDHGLGRDLVPEGGAGEGFTNTGDALFVSPQQLDKYFATARKLADRATILPGTGIRFREQHLGVRGPAQVKSDAEHELVVWYQKTAEPFLPKDDEDLRIADYILACWKWKHRESTKAESLESLAAGADLNASFLQNWWHFLEVEGGPASRYTDLTRAPWRQLPGPTTDSPTDVPSVVRERIETMQRELDSWFLPRKWPVLRSQQDSDELRSYDFNADTTGKRSVTLVAGDLGDGNRGDLVVVTGAEITRNGKKEGYADAIRSWVASEKLTTQKSRDEGGPQPGETSLSEHIQKAEGFLERLGKHPLGLDLEASGLVLQAPTILELPLPPGTSHFKARGRLEVRNPDIVHASAQWMATCAPPPDPTRTIPGVVTVWKRGSETHSRISKEFSQLHSTFSLNLEHRLNQVAQNRHRGGKAGSSVYYFSDAQLLGFVSPEQASHFTALREDWRFVSNRAVPKNLEAEWDAKVLAHLEDFAFRAWRRPISRGEREQLASIYNKAVAGDLDRESAAREVLVRVLVAPAFIYKLEAGSGEGVRPISPWELASRLSFFLWASIPDPLLLQKAEDGSLLQPAVLKEQTLRMLRDARSRGLARQFAAQWLDFQDFETASKVDTGKFPEFNPELRRDLFEEAITFLSHVIQTNRPVGELLFADYTFLNERLARHYGIPGVSGDALQKFRVADFSRGGLLGMGAVLTKTSYPHRTSPVLRGNWLLRNILGTPTPAPPNDVPKLDENVASAKTLRERLQQHRSDRACAVCHDKMDPLGFALESFDAIGRVRRQDESGAPVDDSSRDRDGRVIRGFQGLREHLQSRLPEFHRLFGRKLMGYALGRSVLPTDKVLLDQITERLQNGEAGFAETVVSLVQSRQFLHKRGD